MLPRRGGRKEAQGAPVEGRGGAHAEELQTRLHLLRADRGPSKHLLSFNPQESGRETLPCPRLSGGGASPQSLGWKGQLLASLQTWDFLSHGEESGMHTPFNQQVGKIRPTTSLPSSPRSVENRAVSPIAGPPTQTRISNPRCTGTHLLEAPSEARSTGGASQPTQPSSRGSAGLAAPHRWEGAQKGKQSLAGGFAKSCSQHRPRAEVTRVQIKSRGWERITDSPKKAPRKGGRPGPRQPVFWFQQEAGRRPKALTVAHSTGGTQHGCGLRSTVIKVA